MNFYTNVTQWGNNLLVREVVNGERINTKVKYKPTLYAAVQEPTPFKTLKCKYVTPIQHDTINEAKEWIEVFPKKDVFKFRNIIEYQIRTRKVF